MVDFHGVNRALHHHSRGQSNKANLPDWLVVGGTLKYISKSRGDEHEVNVEKIEDARQSVLIRFEQDRSVWKRIPFTEINLHGNGILRPVWKQADHEKAILTVPEKPADFVEPQVDESQEEALSANAVVEGPQMPSDVQDGEKTKPAEEIPKKLEANSEAEMGSTHSLEAQPEEEPEVRGDADAQERRNDVLPDDAYALEENACADPYTTFTDPYLYVEDSCEIAEVCADPYFENAVAEQEVVADNSAVAEEPASSKSISKEAKARKGKPAKERAIAAPEEKTLSIEKCPAPETKKSLSTAVGRKEQTEAKERKKAKVSHVEEKPCIETEEVPAVSAKKKTKAASKAINDDDVGDTCDTAEVCADPYIKTAVVEQDALGESSSVVEDLAASKSTSKDGKARKRKAVKESAISPEGNTLSIEKCAAPETEDSLSAVVGEVTKPEATAPRKTKASRVEEKPCVETEKVPAASAKRKAKAASKATNDGDVGDACETAEVCADRDVKSVVVEQEALAESSSVADELAPRKSTSKDENARKRKAPKEPEAKSLSSEKCLDHNIEDSLSAVGGVSEKPEAKGPKKGKESHVEESPSVETEKIPAASAKRRAKAASRPTNDESAASAKDQEDGKQEAEKASKQKAEGSAKESTASNKDLEIRAKAARKVTNDESVASSKEQEGRKQAAEKASKQKEETNAKESTANNKDLEIRAKAAKKAMNDESVASSKEQEGGKRTAEKDSKQKEEANAKESIASTKDEAASKQIGQAARTSLKKTTERLGNARGRGRGGLGRGAKCEDDYSYYSDCADDYVAEPTRVIRREVGKRPVGSRSREPTSVIRREVGNCPARSRSRPRRHRPTEISEKRRPRSRQRCQPRVGGPRRRDRERSRSLCSYYSDYSDRPERLTQEVRRRGQRRAN